MTKSTRLLFLALTCAVSAQAQQPAEENVGPELLTPARVSSLPDVTRRQWEQYLRNSRQAHEGDTAFMNAELRRLNVAAMTTAPYLAPDFRYGERNAAWLASDSARRLAESVLTWQTLSGGWSKRTSMWTPRAPGMNYYSETDTWHYTPTFDNGATTGQMVFLAAELGVRNDNRYAFAIDKTFDLIMRAQQPSGCWPQSYPLEGGYHDAVTFNDDVNILILRVLDSVGAGRIPIFQSAQRQAARDAARRGVACLLNAQRTVAGKLTVWGQQHDPITLEIVPARRYELAGLAGRESASIMMYLMSMPSPTPHVVRAVHAAAAWFKANAITGYRYSGYALTRDSSAGPLWARLTEVETGRPIFANRDGIKLYDWEKLTDRRSGYGWFGNEPAQALARYDVWSRSHKHIL